MTKIKVTYVKSAIGYRQSQKIIAQFRPDGLFITGGYVCVPITLAAYRADLTAQECRIVTARLPLDANFFRDHVGCSAALDHADVADVRIKRDDSLSVHDPDRPQVRQAGKWLE